MASILSIVNQSITAAIEAAGDAIVAVQVAASIPFDAQPGEDYVPTWVMYDAKGFFEKIVVEDYPNTSIQVSDRSLVVLQCSYDIDMHDFVKVDDTVYHVHGVKPEVVGSTRVLQKLLVRAEQREGIAWASLDLSAA